MRFLKQLQLQGYKTFAARTDFLFDAGVTAIVGPNGSGKSNVADAVRWVLGEQSYGTLRAKRTEDMIFSGSEQRSRMSMAHVSLVLDNSSGWLPIDFAEVEIARRAYRSGENEYYLNGNRVRLRDIAELLGGSGLSERTYSVVGQGLVDQALSQRPEERRRLFEEAAGITVHQSKREHAERQLAEARTNLTRAQDIVSELTPRLRYLKGQARRAQEYQLIKADLEAQLHVWYGYRWRQALTEVQAARLRIADAQAANEEQAAALNALLEQIAERRAERATLRDRLSDWHRSSSQLHRQAETAQRELAVRSEQVRLLGEQIEDLQRDIVHLRAGADDGDERLRDAEAELSQITAAAEAHAGLVRAAQQDLDAREQQRREQARRLSEAQENVMSLKTRLADRQARLTQIGERWGELQRGEAEQQTAAAAAAAELARLEAQMAELAEKMAAEKARLAALDGERQTQSAALASAQDAEKAAREQWSAAQRAVARLQDQQDMLARLRDEGAGLGAGPRNVLAAAHSERSGTASRLQGIIGALGDLIEVPASLEKAIEAALGGRLQDIVVERWQDAEAAVAFLKQNQGGRATLLPLDTLRPGRGVDAPRMAGVLGVASELVRYDPVVRPAVELALNNIVVVQDLSTARRLLGRENRATLVTVDGEIVRASGSVTGGSEGNRRDSGLLSRARALRELPEQIRAAEARAAEAELAVKEARRRQEQAQAAIAELRAGQREITAVLEKLAAEKNRLQLGAERTRQTAGWHQERSKQAAKELAELAGREADLHASITRLGAELEEGQARVEAAQAALKQSGTDDLVAALARLRAEAEVSASQRQSYQARVNELRRLQRQRSEEIAGKEQRITALSAQQNDARADIAHYSGLAERLAGEIARFAAQIDPAEARLAKLEQEQRAIEASERTSREELRHAQMQQSQAELAYQRAQDHLAHLRGEIEKELGLVALDGEDVEDSQPPLPLNGMVTRLPSVTELPEGLDRDVRNLRAQINRLGPVNLEALAEYAEVEARYNFLTTQSADLQQAVGALEEVIAELDRVMEREFLSTFKAIAAQFREEFSLLFGGGSARLVLSDPESPNTTGIEIIARPPGKREQGLALLSGGERTLTAAALIFSILKVRPTPFCVLDEVDAALDEANVGRFRDALKALSSQTQFLLITHNRGTIEAADTIYGITMGTDNTSQVLSLKLEGQEVVHDATPEPV